MSEPTGNGDIARQHTGTLARIARAQATHPKRTVIGGLLFFFADLVPGVRAAQRHPREQVLDPGLRRAEGDRRAGGEVRRPQRRRAAGRDGRARRRTPRHGRPARPPSTPPSPRPARPSRRPPSAARSPTTTSASRRPIRASATPRCSSPRTASSSTARRSSALEDSITGLAGQGRHHDRVHRRRRAGAARAGRERVHRLRRRAARAADRVPHAGRRGHADRVRADLGRHGLRPAVPAREPDRLQHHHADPDLDDRHRCRHRLHPVHRHALQTGAA